MIEIATQWETKPLSEVAKIIRNSVTPEKIQQGSKYVGLENITNDGAFFNVREVENGELASNKFQFTPEHVLYGKLRPYLSKIARPNFSGICSTDILPIEPGKRVDRDFLFHYLRQPEMVQFASSQSTGANLPRLSPTQLAKFPIPLPPLEEQKRIAAILDKADAIRRQRQESFLVGKSLGMATFLKMFGDVSINNKSWELVKVADAGDVQLGRQRAPRYQSGEFTRPYLRVANVYEDRLALEDILSMDFNESDFDRFSLQADDILLNEGQSTELVGRPAIWQNEIADCCFQNTLIRFRAYREKTEPEYALCVFLRYLHAGKFASVSSKTSSVAHLGAARFARMPFPLPPIKLQAEFARVRKVQRRLVDRMQSQLTDSTNLFGSLVQRAFNGEL
jgi:type I restriction enzyme, S subunit